jgi:hypothetical protein
MPESHEQRAQDGLVAIVRGSALVATLLWCTVLFRFFTDEPGTASAAWADNVVVATLVPFFALVLPALVLSLRGGRRNARIAAWLLAGAAGFSLAAYAALPALLASKSMG